MGFTFLGIILHGIFERGELAEGWFLLRGFFEEI